MSTIQESTNRFLTDHRLKSFIINSSDQQYQLAMSGIISGDVITFYTIFKPVDYDHIIYMSTFSPSWKTAKSIFKDIALQIAESYNINLEEYPDLHSFIQ